MKKTGATVDELLQLATGEVTTSADRTEAEIYFDENSIQAGINWVDDRLVYWAYLKWSSSIGRMPVDRKLFIKGAQKRFKRLTSHGKCYFKLDREVFDVPKEEWEEVQRDYNLEKRKKQWRKNVSKAQLQRRKNEKLQKREALKRKKGQPESPQLKTPDLKNNTSQE